MTSPLPPHATIADVGEFGLIDLVVAEFAATTADRSGADRGSADRILADRILVGPGDDAAVVRIKDGHIVVSTDMLVEGRHFRRTWVEARDIGHRAAAANLSDINAMGGRAHTMTIGLAAPADLPAQWAVDFASGFANECAKVGAQVVGGDLTSADQIVISVTAIGSCRQAPVLRDGAVAGDVVALCGRQGWAAGGLAVLGRGFRSPRVLVEAYQRPEPPYKQGARAAAAGATALIDISDGLLAEAGHLARASGVRIDIDSAALEVAEPLHAVGAALGMDPMAFVLTGGDDHALLGVFPPEAALPTGWHRIGRVLETRTAADPEVTVDEEPYDAPGGWSHF